MQSTKIFRGYPVFFRLPPWRCDIRGHTALSAFLRRGCYHTFQTAFPDCHNCSSTFLSRKVSMGCQKP